MAILERTISDKRRIDLAGPQGNAYVLLGIAESTSKQLGNTEEETKAIMDSMMSSDYENLINVFDEHFGKYYDLIRP